MPSQEDIEAQQELLAAHRRTLSIYLRQLASTGVAHAPPAILNGIHETRENITRIKSIMRGWAVEVDDLPDDEAIPTNDHSTANASTINNLFTGAGISEQFRLEAFRKITLFTAHIYDEIYRLQEFIPKFSLVEGNYPKFAQLQDEYSERINDMYKQGKAFLKEYNGYRIIVPTHIDKAILQFVDSYTHFFNITELVDHLRRSRLSHEAIVESIRKHLSIR